MLPNRGRKRGYFLNILLGLDQFIGTPFGIDADISISSWCGKNKIGKWQQKSIDWLFWHMAGQQDHCLKSIEDHTNCK